jgi:hypothetical protein
MVMAKYECRSWIFILVGVERKTGKNFGRAAFLVESKELVCLISMKMCNITTAAVNGDDC